jgi:macrolide-specific efflux system membrane fusion protein
MIPSLILSLISLTAQPSASASKLTIESAQVTLIEQVQVSAREAGILKRLEVREGELVKVDQLLGLVEDDQARVVKDRAATELTIAQEKANSDVDFRYAKKSHEVAQAEYQRALDSVKKFSKSISQTEVDRLQLAAERAELQIEQADRDRRIAGLTRQLKVSELEAAALDVERRKIASPLAGIVVDVYRRPGEWVNPGDRVLRLLRIDKLRIEAFLNARLVNRRLVGAPVTLTTELAGRKETFEGEVVFVSPEVEPVSGQFRIWAEVRNRDNLLSPGLSGTLSIGTPGE